MVSAQTPLGAGLAFAARYEWEVLGTGKKKVALCYLGDGAIDQGAFHEALNMASLFGLPVIYIIENNGYSMGTAIERHTANCKDLISRGKSYGIKSIEIDGFDVLNVYDEFKPFADECRDLQRPGFVDLKTYRYMGHSLSDPQKYRTKEEVDSWKEKDSIAALADHLLTSKAEGGRECLTEAEWKAMRKEIAEVVRDSVDFAEKAAEPDVEAELYSDVYINPLPQSSPIRDFTQGEKNPLL
ncbi:Pyruvate dehydrogenase E1 component alpha subunit [hydrothermal vent metagenome]|uniref:Pyruvate dehydrogenase E1 component alpha subunit n=1 Tax=hydrothermal vent metagenome TaxID=652676 RepID=A0A3B1DEA5_9ZZZZ